MLLHQANKTMVDLIYRALCSASETLYFMETVVFGGINTRTVSGSLAQRSFAAGDAGFDGLFWYGPGVTSWSYRCGVCQFAGSGRI